MLRLLLLPAQVVPPEAGTDVEAQWGVLLISHLVAFALGMLAAIVALRVRDLWRQRKATERRRARREGETK